MPETAVRIGVMGVMGAGKTATGLALAARLGVAFLDADDFHSASNRRKLAAGRPLSDKDRWPWLDAVGEALRQLPGGVLACSALRQSYRDRLEAAAGPLTWVWLNAPQDAIAPRLADRKGHFASAALLQSQFALLEPPSDAIEADAMRPLDELVETLLAKFATGSAPRG